MTQNTCFHDVIQSCGGISAFEDAFHIPVLMFDVGYPRHMDDKTLNTVFGDDVAAKEVVMGLWNSLSDYTVLAHLHNQSRLKAELKVELESEKEGFPEILENMSDDMVDSPVFEKVPAMCLPRMELDKMVRASREKMWNTIVPQVRFDREHFLQDYGMIKDIIENRLPAIVYFPVIDETGKHICRELVALNIEKHAILKALALSLENALFHKVAKKKLSILLNDNYQSCNKLDFIYSSTKEKVIDIFRTESEAPWVLRELSYIIYDHVLSEKIPLTEDDSQFRDVFFFTSNILKNNIMLDKIQDKHYVIASQSNCDTDKSSILCHWVNKNEKTTHSGGGKIRYYKGKSYKLYNGYMDSNPCQKKPHNLTHSQGRCLKGQSNDDLYNGYWDFKPYQNKAQRTIQDVLSMQYIPSALCLMKRMGHTRAFLKNTKQKHGVFCLDLYDTEHEMCVELVRKMGLQAIEGTHKYLIQNIINFQDEFRFFIIGGKILKGIPVRRKDTVLDDDGHHISPYICKHHDNHDRVYAPDVTSKYAELVQSMLEDFEQYNALSGYGISLLNCVIDVGRDEHGVIRPIEINSVTRAGSYGYNYSGYMKAIFDVWMASQRAIETYQKDVIEELEKEPLLMLKYISENRIRIEKEGLLILEHMRENKIIMPEISSVETVEGD